MTDKHLHCVYCKPTNIMFGECRLTNEPLFLSDPHCDKIVLRPIDILTYYIMYINKYTDCNDAITKASEFINESGFNNYPKKGSKE